MATLYTYQPILACVQQALGQLAQTPPTGVYDSQDEHAILMRSYANLVGVMLSESEDWQQLTKELSITGDGVTRSFPLPADISRFIPDTGWSHANRRPVIIVNEQQAAAIRSWMSQSFFVNPACQLQNDQLQFLTAPALNENITFTYIHRNWVLAADGTTSKSTLDNNADTPLFDAQLFVIALKLKWLAVRGMPTGGAQDEFNLRYGQVTTRDKMANALSLNGGTFTGFRYLDNFWNAPDTGLGT